MQSNLCITTTFGTFQNGLNHSFTNAFTHLNKYHIVIINNAEFQLEML